MYDIQTGRGECRLDQKYAFINIYWIKQPDDYLEQKFKFDLPPTYWPNGTPQGP